MPKNHRLFVVLGLAVALTFSTCSRKGPSATEPTPAIPVATPPPVPASPTPSPTPINPNQSDSRGRTPFMDAAESGDAELLQKFLTSGARPSLADHDGHTALYLALQAGKVEAVRLLMQQETVARELKENAAGLLPLAVRTGERDLLVEMLNYQPRGLFWQPVLAQRLIQALWEKDTELVHLLRAAHTSPPPMPGHEQTLLAYTVAWNAPEQTQLLIESGTPSDEPLLPVNDPAFQNLLPTPRLRTMLVQEKQVTPLILAAGLGYGKELQTLLKAGANPYARTSGRTSAINFIGTEWDLLKLLIDSKDPRQAPYRVKIDLSEQWAYYYEQDRLVMKCIVSSGKAGFSTPTGRFFITDKDRSKMSSIYDVEMPYFMRLNGSAVGLHAGPTNGHPISHGCVRMPEPAAKMLFEKAPIGTLVTIVE